MKTITKIMFVALLTLSGCRQAVKIEPPIPHTEVVHTDTPAPAVVVKPKLYVDDLKPESSDDDVVKAYSMSLEQLKTYAKQLEAALQPFIDAAKGKKDNQQ